MMKYRFVILAVILMTMAACAPVTMNGELVSDKGGKLGQASMTASDLKGLRKYSVKAVLPDETVFRGQMEYGNSKVVLFDDNGVSMNCDFELNDPAKGFKSGGSGFCSISDGQKLKVKF